MEGLVGRQVLLFRKDTNQSSACFNLFKLNGSQVEVEGSKIPKHCRMHTLRSAVQKLFSDFQKWKQRIRKREEKAEGREGKVEEYRNMERERD